MGYKVMMDDEDKNILVDVNGQVKALGELTDKEVNGLRMSGKRYYENGEKADGQTMQLAALLVARMRGKKLRKIAN